MTRSEMILREGDPATEITRAATIFKADLIVMGTHARVRLAQAVLGSTVHALTRKATIPVMTVAHPPEERSERIGMAAWQI